MLFRNADGIACPTEKVYQQLFGVSAYLNVQLRWEAIFKILCFLVIRGHGTKFKSYKTKYSEDKFLPQQSFLLDSKGSSEILFSVWDDVC